MNQSENHSIVKKGEFVELKFSGLADGKVFDSNILEDLKQINEKAVPEKTIIILGERMVIRGLDEQIIGKELNKNYEVIISSNDAFGPRRRELVKIIPLKVFHAQKIQPSIGASFVFDNQLAKIIAISGARVITDFNNPLAGKDITYKFTILRIVDDLKERAKTVCKLLLRHVPEISVEENIVTINGPKILENYISNSQDKFKEFLGKEVLFKEIEIPKEDK